MKKISYTRINYDNINPTEEEITIDIEEQKEASIPEYKKSNKKSSENDFNNLLRGMMTSISFILSH